MTLPEIKQIIDSSIPTGGRMEFYSKVGIHASTYTRWMKGEKDLSLSLLRKMCDVLELNIEIRRKIFS